MQLGEDYRPPNLDDLIEKKIETGGAYQANPENKNPSLHRCM